ncbi:MAG: formyltransferase family protein [Sutterellaceae bacterium]|nr:hypothetical protein [Burkholderiaceae bacterium]MDW8430197.1 formyltransferase family protein [Sutterellaceae bacterium]
MKVTVACSDPRHPVNAHLEEWRRARADKHDIWIVRDITQMAGGDVLFLVSFGKRVGPEVRQRYRAAIVLHASDLPKGRGWSPHVWQILEGANELVVSAIEAVDEIDAGNIWAQTRLRLEGHELHDEINAALFSAELQLMDEVLERFGQIVPRPQKGEATFYRRRTPEDSRLDPALSLAAQFDLLRVCDPVRFPAFFEFRGHRYKIAIEKMLGER